MSKLSLIVEREYLSRVKKKSFIVMTLVMPLIILAIFFVPLLLTSFQNESLEVAVIDHTGNYLEAFPNTEEFTFIHLTDSIVSPQTAAQKEGNNYAAWIVITDDLLSNPQAISIYSEKQVPTPLLSYIDSSIEAFLYRENLLRLGVPNIEEELAKAAVKLNITTIKWNDKGEENESSALVATLVGMASTMAIYMFLLIYGMQVMQAVTQEKSSRIIEVMVSSVRPFDLMLGKILAVGLVGLTQLSIWLISAILIFFTAMQLDIDVAMQAGSIPLNLPAQVDQMTNVEGLNILALLVNVNWVEIFTYFILYFVGGFLLYASFFAAIGSAVDNETDTQQFIMPLTLFIVFALFAAIYSIQYPNAPLAFWCSMIPLTSPIVMMVRIPFGVPLWQPLVSLAILAITFFFTTWLASRIYRVGILMYGKKPTYKELWRWINYKN